MKPCPVCEGKKVVGKLIRGETPTSVTVAGIRIPVIGTMVDRPCRTCGGTGEVADDFDQGMPKGVDAQ